MLRTHYAREVTPDLNGQEVTVAGWAHELRDLGKLRFIILRDRTGLIQITGKRGVASDEVIEKMKFPKETVIQVKAKVKAEPQAPGGRELIPLEVKVLNPITQAIPFEITGKVPADLDVRLDNRSVDLRRLETQAVFRVKTELLRAFREKTTQLGFQEIITPCIAAASTEGGTNLFPVVYFDKEAFLVQSPQLYKQLAVIGGMDKVMMTVPVFRAEPHHTTSHLNEVYQMDIEMGFADHDDAMDVLSATFLHMLKSARDNCGEDLKTLGVEVKVPEEVKRHTYSDLVKLLNDNGVRMEWGEDFSREHEKHLLDLLKEDVYLITKWPTKARAFYSMPCEDNPEICNAYDLMYKGLELASGAQRIHLPDLLIDALKKRGLNPESFEFYVKSFRMGAPPHAGWSIGLERATMKVCERANIREVALFPRDRTRLTP